MTAAAPPVTIIVDGVTIDGSSPAWLGENVVVAPIAPYALMLAERITNDAGGLRFVFEHGMRTYTVRLGSHVARNGTVTESLPIAPYLRAGEAIIPLARVARGLGATVSYDASSHTLTIVTQGDPVTTMTPSPPTAAPGPLPTFPPPATPPPRPVISGIPRPRRTPILIEPRRPR